MYAYIRDRVYIVFYYQAEDGIRDLVRSRGLGDVYKRQGYDIANDELTTEQTALRKRIADADPDVLARAMELLSLIHI